MSSDDIAIKVTGVHKEFKLPHEKHSSIKSSFVNIFKGKRTYEKQQVLKDINFEIKKGEFFGIVGRNGSGKSTLLKLLAGIYTPDKGHIQINGKLTPFIELGVGFNPELTGRENVFLNGALLGFSRQEMESMYDEIVEFAELERFMDQKLKNYSSGMQVRLAFSIAIRARSDILLIDEVLAVGDAAFQQKCYNYFEELKHRKQTVVFVSHDMAAVKRFCTSALLAENGKIKLIGSPEDVSGQYLLDNIDAPKTPSEDRRNKSLGAAIKNLEIELRSPKNLSQKDSLEFDIKYKLNKNMGIDLGYAIVNNGFSVAEQNTKVIALPSEKNKNHAVSCRVPLDNLNPGTYTLDVALFKKANFELMGYVIGSVKFIITGTDNFRGGPMKINGEWKTDG